jgi:hypothetical protein
MCTKLERLSITAAQLLDTKELKWKPDGEELKMLDLHRILVTDTTLIDSVSTSARSPSSVTTKISFTWVELMTGTWDQVFNYMDRLSALVYLCPLNLRYSKRGSPSKLRRSVFYYRYLPIWTARRSDEVGLLSLYQKLNGLATAAGLKYPVSRGENGVVLSGDEMNHLFRYGYGSN